MKKIPLTKGKFAIVDDEDFPYLSRFHWVFSGGQAVRMFSFDDKNVYVPMWKFVLQSENNKKSLFLNGNALDIRRENLRVVPAYIANANSEKKKLNHFGRKPTSKYKGVSFASTYAGKKKWVWSIQMQDKVYSGHCFTENEAGESYNKKALELYGEFAYQNKIGDN